MVTAAVDNLLCIKSAGAKQAMVSYSAKYIKILGAVYDLPANQRSQFSPISMELGLISCTCLLAGTSPARAPSSFFMHNKLSKAALWYVYAFGLEK